MAHYNGYDYEDYNNDYNNDNGNNYIDCAHCNSQVLIRNYERHLENVHKCCYCNNYMPQYAIDSHIQRKHMVKCNYCPVEMIVDEIDEHEQTHYIKCKYCPLTIVGDINKHIRQDHPLEATIGMIQLHKITSDRFNELVAENRIYTMAGQIFIKEE